MALKKKRLLATNLFYSTITPVWPISTPRMHMRDQSNDRVYYRFTLPTVGDRGRRVMHKLVARAMITAVLQLWLDAAVAPKFRPRLPLHVKTEKIIVIWAGYCVLPA